MRTGAEQSRASARKDLLLIRGEARRSPLERPAPRGKHAWRGAGRECCFVAHAAVSSRLPLFPRTSSAAGVTASGAYSSGAPSASPCCIQVPAVVIADDRFRRDDGSGPATASATSRSCGSGYPRSSTRLRLRPAAIVRAAAAGRLPCQDWDHVRACTRSPLLVQSDRVTLSPTVADRAPAVATESRARTGLLHISLFARSKAPVRLSEGPTSWLSHAAGPEQPRSCPVRGGCSARQGAKRRRAFCTDGNAAFAFANGRARRSTLAGLAAISISSPVAGLRPVRFF